MKKIINKHNVLILLYCFIISFIILMFTSKNSFLYPFNDWVDANAFFTVGKGMIRGIVPYKDIFEQKGPFLYLIYGFASLISYTSFLGVFILELLFWTLSLFFLYKLLKIFVSTKTSLIVIPLFTTIICTSFSFTHGGSCEEFMLPFFMITLYYFFKHFMVRDLNKKEMLFNGIIAGLVLLSKYTLLGFWIGFTFAIFIDYILKKDYKKAIIYPFVLLGGMFIPFSLFLIYFGINNAILDFFKNYFIVNITGYGEKVSIFKKIGLISIGFFKSLRYNIVSLILYIILLIGLWKFDIPKRSKILFLIMLFISIFFVYFGLKFYRYYTLFVLFFICVPLIIIFRVLDKLIIKIDKKYFGIIMGITLIISITCSNYFANFKEFREVKKEDLFQYKYADILKNDKNVTLVNMGHLDCGLYTISGILPTTYFFEAQNIPYEAFPDILDSFLEYIKNKTTTYIIYYTKLNIDKLKSKEIELFENYELLEESIQYFENKKFHGYLFKVKEG